MIIITLHDNYNWKKIKKKILLYIFTADAQCFTIILLFLCKII